MTFQLGLCRFPRFIRLLILCLTLSKSLLVVMQTHVTLKRIAVYLDEEVAYQVSSLKKDCSASEPYLFGDTKVLDLRIRL